MSQNVQIRTGLPDDFDILGEVIFDAIHNGPTRYSPARSRTWAPALKSGPDWHARLSQHHIFVAEDEHEILGFMTLQSGGYIDFAYVRPNAQGRGLFGRLFSEVKKMALENSEQEPSTHASLMAQPAFEAMGFEIVSHETIEIDGQQLDRAHMSKTL